MSARIILVSIPGFFALSVNEDNTVKCDLTEEESLVRCQVFWIWSRQRHQNEWSTFLATLSTVESVHTQISKSKYFSFNPRCGRSDWVNDCNLLIQFSWVHLEDFLSAATVVHIDTVLGFFHFSDFSQSVWSFSWLGVCVCVCVILQI